MKKILIDANPVVPYLAFGKINGIGRTNLELIRELDRQKQNLPFKIELFTQNLKGISAKRLNTGFKTRHLFLRNIENHNIISRKLHLREIISRYDLQHITHNYEIVNNPDKCIVTIHDAMFFSYPENFLGAEKNRKVIPPFAKKARHIITISENSKKEIMEFMNVPEEKITVIPWGIDHNLLYPHHPGPNKWSKDSPYFISVSCDIGRKNSISVIRSYLEFSKNKPDHYLIMVWPNPSDEAVKLVDENNLKDKVHFVYRLSNEELADLYAGATASFFPSLYEGFGLPVLESMACGVPCVTCRNSSLEEVGGKSAIYVEPFDIKEMASLMEKFENGDMNTLELKSLSIEQAEKFSWEKCAMKTVEVYKECLDI